MTVAVMMMMVAPVMATRRPAAGGCGGCADRERAAAAPRCWPTQHESVRVGAVAMTTETRSLCARSLLAGVWSVGRQRPMMTRRMGSRRVAVAAWLVVVAVAVVAAGRWQRRGSRVPRLERRRWSSWLSRSRFRASGRGGVEHRVVGAACVLMRRLDAPHAVAAGVAAARGRPEQVAMARRLWQRRHGRHHDAAADADDDH